MLRNLDVQLCGGGIVLQLQDVHGLLPLASGDGRLDGFKGAPGKTKFKMNKMIIKDKMGKENTEF